MRSSRSLRLLPLLVALVLGGCVRLSMTDTAAPSAPSAPSGITITIIQLNDVYEIGDVGGFRRLTRVAALRDRLMAENPNTYTVIAGDFFSPSAMGTAVVDGKALDGRQMVAVLNTLGLDLATFGNHEFDLKEGPFYERLAQSAFGWTSANVTDAGGKPFPGVRPHHIATFTGADGQTARVGFVSVTLNSNQKDYVAYADPMKTMQSHLAALADSVDVLIGLTHQAVEQDETMVSALPALDLILGGHEHENYHLMRGRGFTPIAKADANARSVYVHDLHIDPFSGRTRIETRFVEIVEAMPEDTVVRDTVLFWQNRAFDAFRAQGFDPNATVADVPIPLDGSEASVRNRATDLTRLIAQSFLDATADATGGAPVKSDLGVFNSGSIRIDDVLPPGPVTQYDVIRILPFGGTVLLTTMTGAVIKQMLDQGVANQGSGGFLQYTGATAAGGGWLLGGQPLDPAKTYHVAINDFLMSGRESNLGFLTFDNPAIDSLGAYGDVRTALIKTLAKTYGDGS